MKPSTVKLHFSLIRHLRGLLASWEEWVVGEKQAPDVVEIDPDPAKHFRDPAAHFSEIEQRSRKQR